ncbi:uncharacterized protein AMSG_08753 [Thecamonas trahens ATCC 50062]|uniref:Uncharacterized protein n=1 Tax=Thecamonas trahens ATCC 50062 TaxID=461836 RepID=A0A0L0DPB2_THETB|nr:hypothetical protein AMSG_08753 [Thecamonas trahens ATCC 50062]KNC53263.1 hypothetical protein AMSG_08753 [Thecamonas trahens ATCC 50062]|eukprot:XP_013754527.1 hypothetical protein AMSG_08753 [Thecamonas trahens ATCC 50062]
MSTAGGPGGLSDIADEGPETETVLETGDKAEVVTPSAHIIAKSSQRGSGRARASKRIAVRVSGVTTSVDGSPGSLTGSPGLLSVPGTPPAARAGSADGRPRTGPRRVRRRRSRSRSRSTSTSTSRRSPAVGSCRGSDGDRSNRLALRSAPVSRTTSPVATDFQGADDADVPDASDGMGAGLDVQVVAQGGDSGEASGWSSDSAAHASASLRRLSLPSPGLDDVLAKTAGAELAGHKTGTDGRAKGCTKGGGSKRPESADAGMAKSKRASIDVGGLRMSAAQHRVRRKRRAQSTSGGPALRVQTNSSAASSASSSPRETCSIGDKSVPWRRGRMAKFVCVDAADETQALVTIQNGMFTLMKMSNAEVVATPLAIEQFVSFKVEAQVFAVTTADLFGRIKTLSIRLLSASDAKALLSCVSEIRVEEEKLRNRHVSFLPEVEIIFISQQEAPLTSAALYWQRRAVSRSRTVSAPSSVARPPRETFRSPSPPGGRRHGKASAGATTDEAPYMGPPLDSSLNGKAVVRKRRKRRRAVPAKSPVAADTPELDASAVDSEFLRVSSEDAMAHAASKAAETAREVLAMHDDEASGDSSFSWSSSESRKLRETRSGEMHHEAKPVEPLSPNSPHAYSAPAGMLPQLGSDSGACSGSESFFSSSQ